MERGISDCKHVALKFSGAYGW